MIPSHAPTHSRVFTYPQVVEVLSGNDLATTLLVHFTAPPMPVYQQVHLQVEVVEVKVEMPDQQ
jgi:hypothetical protein